MKVTPTLNIFRVFGILLIFTRFVKEFTKIEKRRKMLKFVE